MAKATQDIIHSIVEARKRLNHGPTQHHSVLPYGDTVIAANEPLLFIKPEVCALPESAMAEALALVLHQLSRFGVTVTGCAVVGGPYLATQGIMQRHYGIINGIARCGKQEMSDAAHREFERVFGATAQSEEVLGAFQFLEEYPSFNAHSLIDLWQQSSFVKLGSGVYCARVPVGDRTVYVLNGFHPLQLAHYTQEHAAIVACSLQSDTTWALLRSDMVGTTNPLAAKRHSIRWAFLDSAKHLGIPTGDYFYNYVHMSGGPLEGIAETIRFMSNFDRSDVLTPDATAGGRYMLEAGIQPTLLAAILENPPVMIDGIRTSPFEITEDMNAGECREWLLRSVYQIQPRLSPTDASA